MAILYICGGCPGAGKTTYIKENLEEDSQIHVSRDDIRYALVPEGQNLFSKETLVYNTYLQQIAEGLMDGYDVFADSTHLTKASRYKMLNRIPKDLYDEVHMLWFDVDVSTCEAQNELRKGTRAYMDPKGLRQLSYSIEKPEKSEGFDEIEYIRPKNAFQR